MGNRRSAGLVFDSTGNLYGAAGGGSNSCPGIGQCGTVYQLKPPAKKGDLWTESVLYTFLGKNFNDGETPNGGVIIDQAGNLYGTTGYGGAGSCVLLGTDVGCGVVYELSPPAEDGGAWTETLLYNFSGGNDGYVPTGDLVFDEAGNLYGATIFGGGFSSCDPFYLYCGTIFELSPPQSKGGAWTEKVLYSFQNGLDGAVPNGSLVLDKKGALYGTTFCGGEAPCDDLSQTYGVVFRLRPPRLPDGQWSYDVLHHFVQAEVQGYGDGQNPRAGVILDQLGNLYGTTARGGKGASPSGTVFELNPPTKMHTFWGERILHTFGYNEGAVPIAHPVLDGKDNLYGTANEGSRFGSGTMFRLRPPTVRGRDWIYDLLYAFGSPPDAVYPASSLTFDKLGDLYGTSQAGGNGPCQGGGCGTVFEFSPTN